MSDTQNDPTTEPAASPAAPEPTQAAAPPWGSDFDPERAWKTITNLREREKELSKSQLTEDHRSKLDEYERLAEASKSELERAQEAAQKAQDSMAALRERAVTADLRAALTGVVPDPAAVIEDLNVSKFVGDDGEVNAEAITALRNKYAALTPEGKRPPAPNPAQGTSATGASSVAQLTKQDLERLSREGKHDEIVQFKKDGRFDDLLGGKQ